MSENRREYFIATDEPGETITLSAPKDAPLLEAHELRAIKELMEEERRKK